MQPKLRTTQTWNKLELQRENRNPLKDDNHVNRNWNESQLNEMESLQQRNIDQDTTMLTQPNTI